MLHQAIKIIIVMHFCIFLVALHNLLNYNTYIYYKFLLFKKKKALIKLLYLKIQKITHM